MQSVLVNSDAKIRATFTGSDGEATVPTTPTVTITRDSDNTAIVTASSATSTGEGVVTYTLDGADIDTVDLLHVSWSAANATAPDIDVSVVGGFLCSLEAISAAIVASGSVAPGTLTLRSLRERAEDRLEHICNVAFRPSYARETLTLRGATELVLSHHRATRLLTATLDGVNVLSSLTLTDDGYLTSLTDDGYIAADSELTGELKVTYVHGWEVCPEQITQAAIQLAAAYNEAATSAGVSRFREDDQEFWLTVPGMSGAETSLPDVNAAIESYRYRSIA